MPESSAKVGASAAAAQHGGLKELRVAVRPKIPEKDFARALPNIYEKIKDLTGCPCLSGLVRVVLEDIPQEVVKVNLQR
jgi:hypothetical protein